MVVLLSVSILLQLLASALALRLSWLSGRWLGWVMVSMAVALMAVRRGIAIADFQNRHGTSSADVTGEVLVIVVSSMILIGLYLLAPLFRKLDEDEKRHRSQQAELARLGAIVESSSDAIIGKDLAGTITTWNASAEKLYGYSSEEAVGKSIGILVPDRRMRELDEILRKIERGEPIEHFETVRRHRDGSLIDVSLTISPIRDADRRVVGASAIARDITRQKKAERLFRLVFDASPSAMLIVGADGVITTTNALAGRYFGYKENELVGMSIEALVPERFRKGHPASRKGFMQNPETRLMGSGRELYGLRKDGSEFPIEIGLNPIRLDGSLYVLCAIVDISERKKVETEMRASEEQTRLIVDTALDAVITMDEYGTITGWNPHAESIFGWTRRQAIGKSFSEMIPPENPEAANKSGLRRFLSGALDRALNQRREMTARRRNGDAFPVEVAITPLNTGLERRRYSAFVRDITDRKRAEAEIRSSEEQTRLIIETALDAVITIDETGRITGWNPHAERTFGWTGAEVLGQLVAEVIIPASQREAHRTGLRRFLETGSGPLLRRRLELTALRKGGAEFPVELTISPLQRSDGRWTFSAFVRDITERKVMEDTIRRANDSLERRVKRRTTQLAEVNRELEAFNYTVSHDLRAPLRHIEGFLEIFMEHAATKLDAKGREYLDLIADSAHKMDKLVDGLLTFSRMGRTSLNKAPVPLKPMIEDLRQLLLAPTPEREVVWELDELPEVTGDPTMLRQAFFNLISNALKFSAGREVTRIRIGVEDRSDETVIYVRDNGVGFDMNHVDKIFGAFQRLHTDEEFEGSGIGLAFVQRIVHRHGGRVWAVSAPNEGATFYVALPKVKGGVLV
ncbi:MAG: PAS domain S-box protein [Planctomycetes bacterium]|nr:PAS domain S-box protein [Planctomycetota bacterium]